MPAAPSFPAARELAGDLRAAIAGEVRFTPGDRALYSYDASIFRQVPIGVVLPRDAGDVEAALAVCRRHEAPVLGRGCGTGLAGQTVNAAVVFDFSKHMAEIEYLDPATRTTHAIGAQAAYPDRQVVVFTGDGSLTMQLGDFLTAVQHELPIKIVVIKNDTLGLIKWEQLDESSFEASPGRVVPGKLGQAAARVVGKLRDRAEDENPE